MRNGSPSIWESQFVLLGFHSPPRARSRRSQGKSNSVNMIFSHGDVYYLTPIHEITETNISIVILLTLTFVNYTNLSMKNGGNYLQGSADRKHAFLVELKIDYTSILH
jgi:hypothetical protein